MVYQEGQNTDTGRTVNLQVEPYFSYGSTRFFFAGRPVNIRVHPYFYVSTRKFTGRKRSFIKHSLSSSPTHRPNMAEILFKMMEKLQVIDSQRNEYELLGTQPLL